MRSVLPDICCMPDLDGLTSSPLISSALASALIGDPDATSLDALYRRNLARLVDKAVAEYQRARSAVIAQARELQTPRASGPAILIFSIANALEDCVLTTNRALRLYESLKAGRLSQRIPRLARRALESHSKGVGDVRNALEHIDDAIRSGEVLGSGPVMAAIVEPFDRMQVGPHTLELDDLARSLRELHGISHALLNGAAN
jgi:hypothetical protein